ncbi:type IV pilus secretin PilQ [Zobellella denitrificans]|uniref:type IV pilus secretin PilQ n=1 Tax=Zobellella denitrificans TaxID=347534 RepID=UPI000B8C3FCF|nr:type IV pilus secretin PilQ family protein [Zobellella denitrificans]OXS14868.1 type IV pilus secretin PilQ [Zobellella denitrificans]
MTKRLGWLVLGLLLCGRGWAAVSLEQIRVNPLTGDQLVLELEFDAPPSGVTELMRHQPDRLVLQIPDARSALRENPIPIERQGINVVDVRRVGPNLEVALGFDRVQPHRLQAEGNRLQLLLGAGVGGTGSDGASLPPGAINAITGIDFRRGREGQGQVLVSLERSSAAVDMQVSGNQVIAKFHNTHVADELLRVLDVNDFATPAGRIRTSRDGGSALVTVENNGAFDYRYDQSERLFVLEVARPAPASSGEERRRYTGKPISMNFQDIPVRTVLQLIADFNNFNLVTTDSVQGNITLRLDGVPWEQALDTILQVRGLDKRLDGNILLVAPAAELAGQERQQLENRQAQEVLAPLVTEPLQVNYARAADIRALLVGEGPGGKKATLSSQDESVSVGGEADGNRASLSSYGGASELTVTTRAAGYMLSERGSVSVDERTNTLIVNDTRDKIDEIRGLLKILDIPVKQVVIEARMVTIDDGFEEAFGVRWGYSNDTSGGHNRQSVSGTLEGFRAGANDNSLNVNLPVAGAAGSIAFQIAKLDGGRILDLELSALERENRAEIIASPRVTTSNQKPALIRQGTQIPFSSSSERGTQVQFKNAVLSLMVMPQITPDNRVVLDLIVTQDTIGERIPQATGGEAVAINTQSITTQVLVNDGETLVLGGIFQQNISRNVTKVPVLGDIPVVGNLFKTTRDNNSKRELIIFVTPRIVHDSI